MQIRFCHELKQMEVTQDKSGKKKINKMFIVFNHRLMGFRK